MKKSGGVLQDFYYHIVFSSMVVASFLYSVCDFNLTLTYLLAEFRLGQLEVLFII